MAWPYAFFLVWTAVTSAVVTLLFVKPRRRAPAPMPDRFSTPVPRTRDPATQQGWRPARAPVRVFESWDHAETLPQQPAAG